MQRSIPPSENPRQATVAIEFVRGMLAGLDRRSIDTKDFLRQVGLDLADDASRIPVDRYAALYNLLNRTFDDEAFCLFAQPMRVGSFEFLCRGSLSAPTLGEALARMGRFLRLILPDLKVSIRRQHGQAELVIAETRRLAATPDDPGRIFAFEWLLRLLHGLSCWLVARGLALDSVLFPYRRPKHSADYALIFTADSRFAPTVPGGTGTLVASFNANLLELPVRRDRAMVTRIRDLLRDSLPVSLSLEEIADRLYLSPRTIHRRLEEEGASFRTIKDALRRDLALARLTKTQRSIAQIAGELGYADTSAFYRAVVDWTGISPVQYRKRLQSEKP